MQVRLFWLRSFTPVSSRSSYIIVSPWRNRMQRIVIEFKHHHYYYPDNSHHSDNSHDYGQRSSYRL